MDERRIGLIGAMPVEVAPFLERMRLRCEDRNAPKRESAEVQDRRNSP